LFRLGQRQNYGIGNAIFTKDLKLISKMIHIKKQKNGLNLNSDTELLDESYFDILNGLIGLKV